jgi:hypothetical protein
MKVARISVALAIAAVLAGAGGDRFPRTMGSADGVPFAAPATIPPFALFGWVSPPNETMSLERMRELAGAGLNVALPAWNDSGRIATNRPRMQFAAQCGVGCIAWDERFGRAYGNPSPDAALLDSILADYASQPGFLAYYFGDEPARGDFPMLARIFADLRAREPSHPSFNNLLGRSAFSSRAEWERYTRDYVEFVHPAILCNDYYNFLADQDRGGFVENVAGLQALARKYGLPFWVIVQLVQHGPYRALSPGELRWQVSHLLAYGARGVGYFTYWTPAPDPDWNWQPAVITFDGARTPWYDVLASFNPAARAAGEMLAGLSWVSTQHAGSVPIGGAAFVADDALVAADGRAAIGRFVDGAGTRYLLIANSDSAGARTIALSLRDVRRVWRLGTAPESWAELSTARGLADRRAEIALDAGGFALLRLESEPVPARGPALRLGPNPGLGEMRFAVSRAGAGARIEIVDAGGRLVWSRALDPGTATVTWRGERDGGGRARPGLYLARVIDASGVTTARVSWLGTPR